MDFVNLKGVLEGIVRNPTKKYKKIKMTFVTKKTHKYIKLTSVRLKSTKGWDLRDHSMMTHQLPVNLMMSCSWPDILLVSRLIFRDISNVTGYEVFNR